MRVVLRANPKPFRQSVQCSQNEVQIPIERLRVAHHNLQKTFIRLFAKARASAQQWMPKPLVEKISEFEDMLVELCIFGEFEPQNLSKLLSLTAFPNAGSPDEKLVCLRNSLLFALGGQNLNLAAAVQWLQKARTHLEAANHLLNPATVTRPAGFRDCSLGEFAGEIEHFLSAPAPL